MMFEINSGKDNDPVQFPAAEFRLCNEMMIPLAMMQSIPMKESISGNASPSSNPNISEKMILL